jgi:hypothetical protein
MISIPLLHQVGDTDDSEAFREGYLYRGFSPYMLLSFMINNTRKVKSKFKSIFKVQDHRQSSRASSKFKSILVAPAFLNQIILQSLRNCIVIFKRILVFFQAHIHFLSSFQQSTLETYLSALYSTKMSAQGQGHQGHASGQSHQGEASGQGHQGQDHGKGTPYDPTPQYDCFWVAHGCKTKVRAIGAACDSCRVRLPTLHTIPNCTQTRRTNDASI